jgi:hypothetical protein
VTWFVLGVNAFTPPFSTNLHLVQSTHHYRLIHNSVKTVNMFLSFNLFIVLAHITLAVARRSVNRYQDLMANTIPAGQRHNDTLATRTSLQIKKPNRSRKTGAKQVARLQNRSRLASESSTPARYPRVNAAPTPQPTGPSSVSTTVHITSVTDFALLLPVNDGGAYLLCIFIPHLTTLFSLRTYIRC